MWESYDGLRTVRVERAEPWGGCWHLKILNLETDRLSSITDNGLWRKFYTLTPFR